MIDLLRRLFISKPSEPVAKEPEVEVVEDRTEGEGPLFGLHPPEGTYFKVKLDDSNWAFVYICDVTTNNSLALGGASIYMCNTVETAIKDAANRALRKYNDTISKAKLKAKYEGNYPPKRVS